MREELKLMQHTQQQTRRASASMVRALRYPLVRPQLAQSSAAGDKTLTKGLQLLEALSASHEPRGISELAAALHLTKSNVHRLLQTLARCGYVMRDSRNERYLLSSKLWQMSRGGRPYEALRRLATPILESVVSETKESAVFVIVEHHRLIVIDQVETSNPVRVVFFSVGQSFAADQIALNGKGLTALQLVALANQPTLTPPGRKPSGRRRPQTRETYVRSQLAQLSRIRQTGAAVSRGEWVDGVNAIAVPILHRDGQLVGALSCFGPADRIPESSLKRLQKILVRHAREFAQQIEG